MSKSIMSNIKECFICGSIQDLDKHHCIGGTANRRLSEKDGLWVYLCRRHHTMSNEAVHQNEEQNRKLKQKAQEKWEETYGSREQFIQRYGKSWL